MKKIILFVFITALILGITGCSKTKETVQKKFEKEDYISFHSTNLKVEADIHIPASVENGTAPRGKGKAHDFSSQIDLLNERIVRKRELLSEEEGVSAYEDGFTTEPGGVYFIEKIGDEVASCLQLDKSTDFYSADLFKQNTDLSFKPYLEVYREISDIFRELGVEVAKEYTCYAMDYENMMIINQKFADDGDEEARTIWSQEEECYYFRFQNTFQDIPVITKNDTSVASFPGDSINAIYGKDGMEQLILNGCYDIQEMERVSLISASEALETVKNKYRELLVEEPAAVNKIELCLYADAVRLEEEKADIYPVWSFWIAETPGGAERKVLVDAHIGKEIIVSE